MSEWKGQIKSPDYPKYQSGLDCKWIINVSVGNIIEASFSDFVVSLNMCTPHMFYRFRTNMHRFWSKRGRPSFSQRLSEDLPFTMHTYQSVTDVHLAQKNALACCRFSRICSRNSIFCYLDFITICSKNWIHQTTSDYITISSKSAFLYPDCVNIYTLTGVVYLFQKLEFMIRECWLYLYIYVFINFYLFIFVFVV